MKIFSQKIFFPKMALFLIGNYLITHYVRHGGYCLGNLKDVQNLVRILAFEQILSIFKNIKKM